MIDAKGVEFINFKIVDSKSNSPLLYLKNNTEDFVLEIINFEIESNILSGFLRSEFKNWILIIKNGSIYQNYNSKFKNVYIIKILS